MKLEILQKEKGLNLKYPLDDGNLKALILDKIPSYLKMLNAIQDTFL